MKYTILTLLTLCFYSAGVAQLGIGTSSENIYAQLDIRSTDQANPNYTDGILIPKINQFPVVNPTAAQDAMLVYLSIASGTNLPGFYFWNNAKTSWISFKDPPTEKIDDLIDGKSDLSGSTLFLGVDAGSNDNGGGNANIGLGRFSLQNGIIAARNTAVGVNTLRNNIANDNIAIGTNAMISNAIGTGNVALGNFTITNNINGNYNVAIGYRSLLFNTVSNNTAIGNRALEFNTIGTNNIAMGSGALRANISGSENIGIGNSALGANTTGSSNTAVGNNVMAGNKTASYNLALGSSALQRNVTGERNAAMGSGNLIRNTAGSDNVALGNGTLGANTTGSSNISIGLGTLSHNKLGSNNIAIGHKTARFLETDNRVTLGKSANNSYVMYTSSWTNASDRALKKEIITLPVGLDFVQQLKPVEYVYLNANSDQDKTFGFIAQDIESLVKSSDIKGNAIVASIGNDLLGLKQVELIPVLTQAIQEQQRELEDLKLQLELINKEIEALLEE